VAGIRQRTNSHATIQQFLIADRKRHDACIERGDLPAYPVDYRAVRAVAVQTEFRGCLRRHHRGLRTGVHHEHRPIAVELSRHQQEAAYERYRQDCGTLNSAAICSGRWC
jgi:hypothetical protein